MYEFWREHEFVSMTKAERCKLYGEFYALIANAGWLPKDFPFLTKQIQQEMAQEAKENGL